MDGILISHPHQDHYGLLGETPRDWSVFCGEATRRLIKLTSGIFGKPIDRDFRLWKSGLPFEVGPFRITPHLTDHSAFDAHMLLIEVDGKRLLYSGDFRTHERKSSWWTIGESSVTGSWYSSVSKLFWLSDCSDRFFVRDVKHEPGF